MTFELVPPNQHRRNTAERAIRTFKNHLLSGLATCRRSCFPVSYTLDVNSQNHTTIYVLDWYIINENTQIYNNGLTLFVIVFYCNAHSPLREWDHLLHQSELTLNLLRNYRLNPNLSEWAYVFGNHDSNKCPLLPPVTKISIHANPGKRASWSFHGEQGRYIGSAIDCYRLITCYIPKTHKERIIDTAKIIPNNILIPQASLNYHLRRTADDLIHLPHQNKTQLTPDTPLTTKSALLDIAKIL